MKELEEKLKIRIKLKSLNYLKKREDSPFKTPTIIENETPLS